jgi:hypothetical protein
MVEALFFYQGGVAAAFDAATGVEDQDLVDPPDG